MMKENLIQVICGPGKGKTASALGRGISALIHGKNVIMVQFLKGSMDSDNMEVLKRLEPEFKLFRFEKSPVVFDQLSEEEKEEARINIRNGLNFSKKVLVTGECDILILDEPTAGLDPKERVRFREMIARQGENNIVLLSTHIVSDVEQIADKILMMKEGQLIFEGTRQETGSDLEKLYLEKFGEVKGCE